MSGISSSPISGAPISGGSSGASAIIYNEDIGSAAVAIDANLPEILPAVRAGLVATDLTMADSLPVIRDRILAASSVQAAGHFKSNADASGSFADAVGAAWAMLVEDAGTMQDDETVVLRKLALVADTLQAMASVNGRLSALAAVAVAAVLEGRAASGWSVSAEDQATLVDEARSMLAALLAVDDAATVAGDAETKLRLVLLVDSGATTSDDPVAMLRSFSDLGDGAVIYCTLRIGNTDYQGWVLNTELRAVTEYRNVPFDSFAILNGRTYAAGVGGIYELTGDTDSGEPIEAWIKPFLTDFGSQKLKRCPDLWLGIDTAGAMFVKMHTTDPHTGAKLEDWYAVTKKQAQGASPGRTKIGRGLRSTFWGLTLQNVDGADFALHSIELRPLIGDRH